MESFTFNSTDMYATYGVMLAGHPGPSEPSSGKGWTPLGGSHGAVLTNVRRGVREMKVLCAIPCTSDDQLLEYMDAIRLALNPGLGEKWLQFAFESRSVATAEGGVIAAARRRGYYARRQGSIDGKYVGGINATFSVDFISSWPNAYSLAEQGQSNVAIASDPENINEPATGVVLGNAPARPVIIVRNETGAEITGIIVTNNTTGEVCEYTGALADDSYLRLQTASSVGRQTLHADISTDKATWNVNAMSAVTSAQDFITLTNGIQNDIQIDGISAGKFWITYRAEFR